MTLSFIIPVAIVLLAAYIFKNSADEMAYLAACIAVVALLVALIVAPWQLKLLLLSIVALTSTKVWFPSRQLESDRSSNVLAENSEDEILIATLGKQQEKAPNNFFNPFLKGSYRGVNYEHNTSAIAKLSEVKLTGKYRGQVWQSSQVETQTAVQPTFEIKYRGATVNAAKSPKVEMVETEQQSENIIPLDRE